MIERRAYSEAEAGLRLEAAVVPTGPRQVGKTTLALDIAEPRPSIYLDLGNDDDRFPLSAEIEAISLVGLANELLALSRF